MEKKYLIYEKYANNHNFTNELTKNIDVEYLFSSEINYSEGVNAIKDHKLFCEKTKRQNQIIPEIILEYIDLYYPYYFSYDENGMEYRFLVFSIDIKKIENYYEKHNNLPELLFFILLCNYDNKYKNSGVNVMTETKKNSEIKKNTENIVNKVIQPNSDPTDPIENQPDYAKLQLYDYQKKSIKWMLSRENEKKNISLDKYEIVFGNVIVDILGQKIYTKENRNIVEFNGGALIDEVGLGKTYQMIIMSLCNPSKIVNYISDNDNDNQIYSKATLIICPNQLVGQWIREIENLISETKKVKIIPFYTKIHLNKYTYNDILDADFVVTSYTFLNNKCFYDLFVKNITTSKTIFTPKSYGNMEKIIEGELENQRKNVKNNIKKKIYDKDPNLLVVLWNRIIVDEFHEIHCVAKYNYMENLLRHFKSNYKWCLSGTPFDKSDDSLNGMFNFVTNYKIKNNSEIWLNEDLVNHMKNLFFRRNTKQSVINENKLPPLKENIVWLNFSKTEWMIYNAFLANSNIDKFSVTLRQLCCHPKIADELKQSISNCKSLEDIQKVMVKHYENDTNVAHKKVKLSQCRLKCWEWKLEIAEWKQYARALRKLGYRVKFELDDENYKKIENELAELIKEIGDEDSGNFVLNDYDEDLKDDEETNTNKKKELIIVSNSNKTKILNIVSSEISEKSALRISIEEYINNIKTKIQELNKNYEGKKSTLDYYNNVMQRLKKTTEIDRVSDSDEDSDSDSEKSEKETCGICLGSITGHDLGVTKCGHIFCYNCVKPYIEQKHKCPMCQKSMHESQIYLIEKKIPKSEITTEIKDKQSLINIVGTKLANLIFFLKKNDKHCIIFSQWDDLLRRVGDVLNDYGIKNVFCKGNVWQRDKAIRDFNSNNNIKVIMLSSESAASGTNLTKAEMVILLDPVYGTYEYRRNTEWQSIGRAYRTGQTKQVEVVRFMIKGTVEEKIYNMNVKSDMEEKKKAIDFEKTFVLKEENIELEKNKLDELVEDAKLNKEIKEKKPIKKTPVKSKKITKKIYSSSDSELE